MTPKENRLSSQMLSDPFQVPEREQSLGVCLFVCLLLYMTRGFVYKTFCVDSQGNEGGETALERERAKVSKPQFAIGKIP